MGGFIVLILILALYFTPSIIASNRRHPDINAILALNFFLGWTVLGWIGALVWALKSIPGREKEAYESPKRAHNIWLGVLGIIFVLGIIGHIFREQPKSSKRDTPPLSQSSDATNPISPAAMFPWLSWQDDLTITAKSWSKSDFGVITWNVTVKNSSSNKDYKELRFKTIYWGPSGTKIDLSPIIHTERISIARNETLKITVTEYAHSQAKRADIEIDNAVEQ